MAEVSSAFECEHRGVRELALALKEAGAPGFENIYKNEGGEPFFMLPKKYKRENEGDPEYHYVYVDVYDRGDRVEYRVTMLYTPLYFYSVEDCVALCKGLLDEKIAEVALVTPIGMASGFVRHTGSHEENVRVLAENGQALVDKLKGFFENKNMLLRGNVQELNTGLGLITNAIGFREARDYQYNGITVYAASYLCAYHPEIYVFQ